MVKNKGCVLKREFCNGVCFSQFVCVFLNSKRSRSRKNRNIAMETKGGQMRKIHILYFISRMGRIEHPHLISVHHLNRNGVYLRDVKRWLAELRGKDMPEGFAWSYKRRYKTDYVWQDLLDDDLITPISDNEYVLKGSQINPIPFGGITGHTAVRNDFENVGEKQLDVGQEKQKQKHSSPKEESDSNHKDSQTNTPRKVSFDITQESSSFSADSERSTLSSDEYDSLKLEEDKLLCEEDKAEEKKHENQFKFYFHRIYSLLNKKGNNNYDKDKTDINDSSLSSLSSPQVTFTRSKSYSHEAAYIFRKLISCRTVDTNDTVLVKTKTNDSKRHSPIAQSGEEKIGGSARVFGTTCNQQQQQEQEYNTRKSFDGVKNSERSNKKKGEFMNQKTASAAINHFENRSARKWLPVHVKLPVFTVPTS